MLKYIINDPIIAMIKPKILSPDVASFLSPKLNNLVAIPLASYIQITPKGR